MHYLNVKIIHFEDEHQPGFVTSEFVDAQGHRHTIFDKVPIFTSQDIWVDSEYPIAGQVRCEVLSDWQENSDRRLAMITIAKPDGLETAEGRTEFIVLQTELEEAWRMF